MTHYPEANREIINIDLNLMIFQEFTFEDFKISIDVKQYNQISNTKKGLNAITGHPLLLGNTILPRNPLPDTSVAFIIPNIISVRRSLYTLTYYLKSSDDNNREEISKADILIPSTFTNAIRQ